MDLVIHDLPAKLLEELDRKAKASGRSVEAEAAAIIATSLAEGEEEADPVEAFLKRPMASTGKIACKTLWTSFWRRAGRCRARKNRRRSSSGGLAFVKLRCIFRRALL